VTTPQPAPRRWPLQRRVCALLLVTSVLPPVLVTAVLVDREQKSTRAANIALLQARVDEVGNTLQATLQGYHAAAARAARDREIVAFCVDPGARGRVEAVIDRLQVFLHGDDAIIRGVGITDLNGTVIAASESALLGANVSYREYFQSAVAGRGAMSDPYLSLPVTGSVPTIAMAEPVRSGAGEVVGVYVLWLHARTVWDVMRASNGQAGPGSFFVLFDRHGVRIGHSANEALLFHPTAPLAPDAARAMIESRRFQGRTKELLEQVVPFPLDEARRAGRDAFRRFSPTNKVWNLGLARQFPALGSGWMLLTLVPERVVEVRLATLLPRVAAVCLVGLALAMGGVVLLMRHVVRPIRRLADAAVALERGGANAMEHLRRVEMTSQDELGDLARAFHSMAITLADRERRLRGRNRDLRDVLDNVGQGFVATDRLGIPLPGTSAIAERWFGTPRGSEPIWSYLGREDEAFSHRLQRGWEALVAEVRPDDAEEARVPMRLRRGERTFAVECRHVRVQGRAERVVLVISDVTAALERELAERQMQVDLQQALKLEAVGRLAAGVAHEINTPIQFIGDNTHFLQEAFSSVADLLRSHQRALEAAEIPLDVRESLRLDVEASDLEYLLEQGPKAAERTLEGVSRVATLVRAMKEFAHPDQNEAVASDVNRALQATLEVARHEYKLVAEVHTDFGDIPLVTCHAGDLNQVFLNLIVNAAHAIEAAVKGTPVTGAIGVRTRRKGADVVVEISDTGTGIPDAIRDKIFDPFFTTKEVGRGSGQGLAIARSVVLKHKGSLTFDTRLGEGTVFYVRVPIDPGADYRATHAIPNPSPQRPVASAQ
jgi:C4-dicarboxylate-specific signal transduction histidine kinase